MGDYARHAWWEQPSPTLPPPLPVVVVAHSHEDNFWHAHICHSSGKQDEPLMFYRASDLQRWVVRMGLKPVSIFESPNTWFD